LRIGTSGTNDFRIAFTDRILENQANVRLPRGWVAVSSTLPDGRTGNPQILQFGGQRTVELCTGERTVGCRQGAAKAREGDVIAFVPAVQGKA
jgi:hypothetical protein